MEHQESSRVATVAAVLAVVAISFTSATYTPYTPPNVYRYGGPIFRPPDGSEPCQVDAYFDMNGVTGTISFYQERKDVKPVKITVKLMGLDQFEGQLGWHVHEWPINFGLLEFGPCSNEEVGGHYDPFQSAASVNYTQRCASDPDECEVGDLSGRHGLLNSSLTEFCFDDYHLDLYRAFGITGRSIVIHTEDDERVACANLEYSDGSLVSTYRAFFPYDQTIQSNTLQGDIILKRIEGKAGMTLHAELYRVDGGPRINQSFEWSLRLGKPGPMGDCSDIRHIYGSKTHANDPIHFKYNDDCNPSSQRRCYIGDLTSKCGPLMYDEVTNRIKHFCTDEQLGVIPLEDVLKLSVVINETDNSRFLTCTKFQPVIPEVSTAYFRIYDADTNLQGHFYFYQMDPHEPTYVRIHLVGLEGNGGSFQIRDQPCQEDDNGLCTDCENLGGVYEPRPDQEFIVPGETGLTGDQALLGELRYKWESFEGEEDFRTDQRSSYIPLFGPFSVNGRSLVLNRANNEPWACANIKRLYPVPPYIPSILGFSSKKKK